MKRSFAKLKLYVTKPRRKQASARRAFDTAKSEHEAAQRELKRAEFTVLLEELDDQLQQAEKIAERIAQDREATARIQINDEELSTLKEIKREVGEKKAALEAVATTLDFSPSDDQYVIVKSERACSG